METSKTLLKGVMCKRAQGKKKSSPKNWKDRFFVLSQNELAYWEKEGSAEKKGSIDTATISAAEAVKDNSFDRGCHLFQVVHGLPHITLYIQAADNSQRSAWLDAIRKLIVPARRSTLYHPGYLDSKGAWTCCDKQAAVEGCEGCTLDEEPLPPPPIASPKPAAVMEAHPPIPSTPKPNLPPSAVLPAQPKPVPSPPKPVLEEAAPPIPPKPAQKQMRALYDYVASQAEDLSMTKGEVLLILEEQPNWWKAKNKVGQVGFVPSNYLGGLGWESEPWFRGKMSRAEASGLLQAVKQEGCFLVRESETKPGEYTLSVSHGDKVHNYHIVQIASGEFYVNESHRFATIPLLIEYHKLNSGGIITRLRRSIGEAHAPMTVGLGSGLLELSRKDFQLGRQLGSGQFGVVQQATYRTGQPVAIKMMKEGKMSADDFMSEAVIMRDMTHPNLVQLLGVCTRDGPLWIVVELVSNGCLLNYLREHPGLRAEPNILHLMTVHIASAMTYLESKRFIHRDLAARNCLLGDNYFVKVADFGLARFVTDDEYISSEGAQFPIKWSAPEVIDRNKFSTKSDVWSFGITCWEIWSMGQIPYPAHRNLEISDLLGSGYRMPRPADAPVRAYELMLACWHQDSECRPSFGEIAMRLNENRDDYW